MSRVTNAILVAHVGGTDLDVEIDSVNSYLQQVEGGGGGNFVAVDQYAGGPKHMECRVYLSAFNHADIAVIVKAVDQAPWRDKYMVQLFVKEQEEDVFILRFSGGSTPEPLD